MAQGDESTAVPALGLPGAAELDDAAEGAPLRIAAQVQQDAGDVCRISRHGILVCNGSDGLTRQGFGQSAFDEGGFAGVAADPGNPRDEGTRQGFEDLELTFAFAFAVNVGGFAFGAFAFFAGTTAVEDVVGGEVDEACSGVAAGQGHGGRSDGVDEVGAERVIQAGFQTADSGAVDDGFGPAGQHEVRDEVRVPKVTVRMRGCQDGVAGGACALGYYLPCAAGATEYQEVHGPSLH